MVSTPLVGLGALAAVVVIARAINRWHAHRAIVRSAARPHARNANGVMVGAEPILLAGTTGRAVLLLHGFNDTPQSLAELAQALHRRGWTVSVPLLPGHGRSKDVLARDGDAGQWIAFVRAEWAALRMRAPQAVIAGQSMGGALAVVAAADGEPAAVVLLAPYLSMGRLTRYLAQIWPLWELFTPILMSDPKKGIRDPEARATALGGGEFTPRLVRQLLALVVTARRGLSRVRMPALVIHSKADYRVPSANAKRSFELLGSSDKTLIWRENVGHVLSVDFGREEVFRLVGDWLDERVPALAQH